RVARREFLFERARRDADDAERILDLVHDDRGHAAERGQALAGGPFGDQRGVFDRHGQRRRDGRDQLQIARSELVVVLARPERDYAGQSVADEERDEDARTELFHVRRLLGIHAWVVHEIGDVEWPRGFGQALDERAIRRQARLAEYPGRPERGEP